MRVRLKGLNSKRKRPADGRVVTYHYAWKGGPRLPGSPGDPEFVAAYNEAVSRKREAPAGSLLSVLNAYQASANFRDREPRTRTDYVKQIRKIEAEFADFPLAALTDRRTRGEFLTWRDRLGVHSKRQADYAFAVLARVLSWAHNRGLVLVNPCEKGGRLYRATRSDKIWDSTPTRRPSSPRRPSICTWRSCSRFGPASAKATCCGYLERLRRQVHSPHAIEDRSACRHPCRPAALRKALDAAKRVSPVILTTAAGKPWTAEGFSASWRKACARAGVIGVTFHDLRGTAVTRLALASATVPEIAAVTGHSLADVRSILDSNYLHRDPALGVSAIRKLERRTKSPD